jgi:membrane protein YdbS with pleckstrin-like domain
MRVSRHMTGGDQGYVRCASNWAARCSREVRDETRRVPAPGRRACATRGRAKACKHRAPRQEATVPTSPTLETPPLHATFNPLIRPYLVAMVAWYLLLSLFGAPLILVWVLGPGQWWARHCFDRLGCTLDDRTLQFRKGILFRVEKTIPLENIQDVTFIEGPILRLYHLSILRVETAGQSPGQAHSMQLVGIVHAHALRDEILARRERLRMQRAMPHANADTPHETLEAIRMRLDEIAAMMRARHGAA